MHLAAWMSQRTSRVQTNATLLLSAPVSASVLPTAGVKALQAAQQQTQTFVKLMRVPIPWVHLDVLLPQNVKVTALAPPTDGARDSQDAPLPKILPARIMRAVTSMVQTDVLKAQSAKVFAPAQAGAGARESRVANLYFDELASN